MLAGGGIIRKEMNARGYRHRRAEDQFSVRGEYARNLQFVYEKEFKTRRGLVIDLIYFAVDIYNEKLIMSIFRENPDIDNGILLNASRSIPLVKFSRELVHEELNKLIPEMREQL